jgi:WD40 repeat protein
VPEVGILDAVTDEILHYMGEIRAKSVEALEWSPEGSQIAAGYDTGLLVIWDVATGQKISEFTGSLGSHIKTLTWHPNGMSIASSIDYVPSKVWDVTTGQLLLELTASADNLAWSPDSTRLAGVDSGRLHIWNATTGELLETDFVGGTLRAVAWSPDSSQIAYGGNAATNTVQIIPAPNIPPIPEADAP